MQRIVFCATWYEGTSQLLHLTELKSHLFEFYFIGWTINRWRRGGNLSTQRKPLVTSFRKCHILKPKIQASSKTRTCAIALVTGKRANHYTFFLSYLSRSLADRWGTPVDFTTSFFHSSRFSAFRNMIFHSRPVHFLMLSSHCFLCLPLCLSSLNCSL